MEVHTRQLQYFMAVAEELSFTRAAQRLHVSQQGLSTQIEQLGHEMDVTLRSRRIRPNPVVMNNDSPQPSPGDASRSQENHNSML
ncbi:helix-turn-helix domain-containing protein [Nocardia sp. NPDC004123]